MLLLFDEIVDVKFQNVSQTFCTCEKYYQFKECMTMNGKYMLCCTNTKSAFELKASVYFSARKIVRPTLSDVY